MFKIDSSGNYSSAASIVAGTSGVDLTFGGNAGATKASSGSAGDGGDFYWLGGAGGNGVGFGDVDGGDAGDGIVDSGVFGTKLNAGTDGEPGYVLIAPTNASGTLFGTTNTALLTGTNIAYFDESIDVNGDVNILGNINAFDGNANVNFILGTAWYHNHAGMTLNFDTANTWYKFNMTTNNRLNGFHMVDGNFQVEESGLYRIDYSADGKGANNHVYLTTIMVNDVNKDNCSSYQTLPAANDYIPMHGFCYLDLLAGDYVTLAVMDDGGTSTGTVYNYDVAIERKGVYGLGN